MVVYLRHAYRRGHADVGKLQARGRYGHDLPYEHADLIALRREPDIPVQHGRDQDRRDRRIFVPGDGAVRKNVMDSVRRGEKRPLERLLSWDHVPPESLRNGNESDHMSVEVDLADRSGEAREVQIPVPGRDYIFGQ